MVLSLSTNLESRVSPSIMQFPAIITSQKIFIFLDRLSTILEQHPYDWSPEPKFSKKYLRRGSNSDMRSIWNGYTTRHVIITQGEITPIMSGWHYFTEYSHKLSSVWHLIFLNISELMPITFPRRNMITENWLKNKITLQNMNTTDKTDYIPNIQSFEGHFAII